MASMAQKMMAMKKGKMGKGGKATKKMTPDMAAKKKMKKVAGAAGKMMGGLGS